MHVQVLCGAVTIVLPHEHCLNTPFLLRMLYFEFLSGPIQRGNSVFIILYRREGTERLCKRVCSFIQRVPCCDSIFEQANQVTNKEMEQAGVLLF